MSSSNEQTKLVRAERISSLPKRDKQTPFCPFAACHRSINSLTGGSFAPPRAQGSSLRPATGPSRSRTRRPAPLGRRHPPRAGYHGTGHRPAGPGRHCGGGRAPRALLRPAAGRRLAWVPCGDLRGHSGGGPPRLLAFPFLGGAAGGVAARRGGCGGAQGLGLRRIREVGNAGAMIAPIDGLICRLSLFLNSNQSVLCYPSMCARVVSVHQGINVYLIDKCCGLVVRA